MINKSFTPEPPIFCCLNSVRNPINASFSFTFCQQIAVFIECDITPPFLLFLCVTQLTPQLNTCCLYNFITAPSPGACSSVADGANTRAFDTR